MFSTVFQDFKIYAFTVYENIALAQTEQTSKEKLDEVLQMGGLSEKISRLKYGGSTYMFREFAEDGVELSGGEQQKLALCRALFKDAPIVILDEPTAGLSPLAEHEIYLKFHEMVKDKTAVYISHRLTSSMFCDKIALFSEAQIVEYGTHQELMDLNGSYAEIFKLQAKYYLDEEGVAL
jgi:ABC-type transport system involved in cytochrome bd biosynthesis fused ATPase/permease subunit